MTTKLLAIALAAGLMVGTGTSRFAQSPTSEKTPGAQMQDKGSAQGSPGASGYAPGHLKSRCPWPLLALSVVRGISPVWSLSEA